MELGTLLRRKATEEEIQPVIDRIQSLAKDRALDPLVASTDVFVTAVCWVGSKSLSHVLACIDRTKGRLLDAGASSPAARAQIITSVTAYWRAHAGVALTIVEKLLNYSILTPQSVAEWVLQDDSSANGGAAGSVLVQPHLFEMVFNTVSKVSARVRQLAIAREIDADTEQTRAKEIKAMKELFACINDGLDAWASGAKDQLLEQSSEERERMIRRWGACWLRVFKRRAAIEEAFVLEASKVREAAVAAAAAAGEGEGGAGGDGMAVDGANGGA
jgi:nuclear cap-binding protein subunit 1